MRRWILGAVWCLAFLAACGVQAHAQQRGIRPYQPYRPSRPTMTRYLDYFRSYNDAPEMGGALNLPGVPSYDGFIRPRQELRQDLRQQRGQLQDVNQQLDERFQRLDDRMGRLQAEVEDLRQLQTVRPSQAAPTGTGGTFMNYSNYFQRLR